MPVNVKCAQCGKSFDIKPSKVKEHNFCCRECYHKHKARNQIITTCYRCGKPITKSPSKQSDRDFCSRACNMKTMNEEMNPTRMTYETRMKLRRARLNTGEGKSYPKLFGRHLHRIVAEAKLGRPLKPGEVVHHRDENKRNASPENLEVLESQKEHAALHAHERRDAR